MSKLKAISPDKAKPSKPKVLIYGKAGAGKTWTSLDFPSCYFIDTEGGADLPHYTDKLKTSGGVYFGVEQGSLDFSTVIGQIQALATEKHSYRTVVIDSITKIFNNEIAAEADRLARAGKKNEFGSDKKPAVAHIKTLISWLQRLDMTVILIAHEKPLWGMSDGQRTEIGVTFDCYEKLEYEFHLALNIVKIPNRRNALIKKTRLINFDDGTTFPWSYDEFAKRFGREILEGDAKPIVLASPEQVQELERLLALVKLPETTIEKWLSVANAQSWKDVDSDKIDASITFIKNKISKGE